MSATEKKIYDSIQKNMSSSLSNLFKITDANRQEWNNQLDAIKTKGMEQIDSIYKPIETNLKMILPPDLAILIIQCLWIILILLLIKRLKQYLT